MTLVDLVELMFALILFVHIFPQKIMVSSFYSNYIIYEANFSKIQPFLYLYPLEFLPGVCTNTLNVCICKQSMKRSFSVIF